MLESAEAGPAFGEPACDRELAKLREEPLNAQYELLRAVSGRIDRASTASAPGTLSASGPTSALRTCRRSRPCARTEAAP